MKKQAHTNEQFKIGDFEFSFAKDAKVTFEDGKMSIELWTDILPFDEKLHSDNFSDFNGKEFRPGFYLSNICFPTTEVKRTITYPKDQKAFTLFEYGFNSLEFHGEIDIENEEISMQGVLKDKFDEKEEIPVFIVKHFKDGKVSPEHFVFDTDDFYGNEEFVTTAEFKGKLPKEIANLKNLTHLTLNDYKGETTIAQLTKLNYLRITNFQDDVLPDLFKNLKNLKELNLYNLKNVQQLPHSIFELNSLEKLYLGEMGLLQLSDKIGQLDNLKEFTLYQTFMDTLPKELFILPKIEQLTLQNCKFKTLPDVVPSPSLKALSLKYNDFTSLPSFLGTIDTLEIESKFKKLYVKATTETTIDGNLFKAIFDDASKTKIDKKVEKYGLEKYHKKIVDTTLNAIEYYTSEKEDYQLKGNTRFGGAPDLPKDISYPTTDGKLWVFLAQINLEELASHQEYLPKKGILYFFVDEENYYENIKVIYREDTNQLEPFEYKDVTFYADYIDEAYDGFKAKFAKRFGFLATIDQDAYDVYEDYEKFRKKINPPLVKQENTWDTFGPHSINSHVYFQGESPQEYAAQQKGGVEDDWMLLLSLVSDSHTVFGFGDAGTLNFAIRKSDLLAKKFTNVVASIESS